MKIKDGRTPFIDDLLYIITGKKEYAPKKTSFKLPSLIKQAYAAEQGIPESEIPDEFKVKKSMLDRILEKLGIIPPPEPLLSPLPDRMSMDEAMQYLKDRGWKETTPTPTPTPLTPEPIPTPKRETIKVKSSDNEKGEIELPDEITGHIRDVFESYGLSEEAARVLHHEEGFTNIEDEQERGINKGPNRGENPEFKVSNIDRKNKDGSIDRGLFRINEPTFKEMQSKEFWNSKMKEMGITSYEDMNDGLLNTRMALLRLMYGNWDNKKKKMINNPSWRYWYAAPQDLRERSIR